ncbi:MAG TPA: sucrase ferredoxin [Gaiellaceae bacterium]|nr:sucrase ferredoxin [Gaiellaceae bacterium]
MTPGRPFCSDVSLENDEPLAATASRVDHWILLEYRGLWSKDAVAGSGLSDQVKQRLREQTAARPHTKLLFIRRTERRGRPELAVRWGTSSERGGALFHTEIESYEDVLELDLTSAGKLHQSPLFLVCTHGKHDRCCARHGRPLYQALDELAEDDWVWQVSHVGGDRFAGNLVVLPDGLYFGRVTPAVAWSVLDEYLAGRIQLEHYRGRTAYTFATQAAERAVRESAGLTGVTDLELEHERPVVVFRGGGRRFEVDVTAASGSLSYLTCTSETLRHPRHYAARILRESAA